MQLRYFGMGFLLILLCCRVAFAMLDSPVIMLENTANQVISELRKERATLKTQPRVAYEIVNHLLLPHVDMTTMSRSVLGREIWKNATAEQKQRFSQEFVKLVVNTYAAGLANYTDETIKFLPLREDYTQVKRIEVQSNIMRSDGPPVRLDYRVILNSNVWKIYDMNVEGVSLLQSFRSEFAQDLGRGDLNQLIQKLAQRNAQN